MNRSIIEVRNISKVYQLGTIGSTSFKEELRRVWRAEQKDNGFRQKGEFWALRGVSFEVQPGEVVGIVGSNGAGKSTLLKILSRITQQTEGEVVLRGRIASLLEVGTGFHPELTGRENVFLNGAILGMTKAEIKNKFDEIVSFAEVERFLDTPVKRYSSGMYVRLAFAVAAHLEPEILLIDEVLAVGDAAFQKKCLGKMEEVAGEGRTILFVSHNMAATLSLCQKGVLLQSGSLVSAGPIQEVVHNYVQRASSNITVPLQSRIDRKGNGKVKLTSIAINGGKDSSIIRCNDRLKIQIGYTSDDPVTRAAVLLKICDQFNRPVFVLDSRMAGGLPDKLPSSGLLTCLTNPINLVPDVYSVNVAMFAGAEITDHVKQVCTFDVQVDDFFGTGNMPSRRDALCLLAHKWKSELSQ